jgi:hypothetical protein
MKTPSLGQCFFVCVLLALRDARAKRAAYMRTWVSRNPGKKKKTDQNSYCRHADSRKEKMRTYSRAHKGDARTRSHAWYAKNLEIAKSRSLSWIRENRDRRNKTLRDWSRQKRASSLHFRLRGNLASRIWWALKRGAVKSVRTLDLIGCSIPFLRGYLEARFSPGMTFANYGLWHIDHIRPCASFDLSDPAQQRLCFHYTNLQPLWAEENLRKGSNTQ